MTGSLEQRMAARSNFALALQMPEMIDAGRLCDGIGDFELRASAACRRERVVARHAVAGPRIEDAIPMDLTKGA